MNSKLTYLIVLFSLGLAIATSAGSIENVNSSDLNYNPLSTTISCSFDRGKSICQKKIQYQDDKNSTGQEKNSRVSQIQNAIVNVSLIQGSESVTSYIKELFFDTSEEYPLIFVPPSQVELFKILFRVIISPNAP